MPKKSITPFVERFWLRVNKECPDDCWLWVGGKIPSGYGMFGNRLVHRIAYTLIIGPIPRGMVLDHICHQKLCCNPNHLRIATIRENSRNRIIGINNTSGFKCVWWSKDKQKWTSIIRYDGISKHLGYFETPIEAHEAYCAAARKYHGEFFNPGNKIA